MSLQIILGCNNTIEHLLYFEHTRLVGFTINRMLFISLGDQLKSPLFYSGAD